MSKFTFSSCTFGSTSITSANTVYGTGTVEEYGYDAENTVSNGINHLDRITKRAQGRITCYGIQIAVCHPTTIPSLSYAIVMTSADGTTVTTTGVIKRGTYDDAKQNTVIEFEVNPIPPSS